MNRERILKDLCWSWTWTIDKILREKLDRRIFGNPSLEDQMRLLSIRTWSQKYKVEPEFIVELLVPYWAKRFERKRIDPSKPKGIGCRIATLCGDKSEEILVSELHRLYPEQEQIRIWKSREQEKQLRQEELFSENESESKLSADTPDKFIQKYRRRVITSRKEFQSKLNSGKLIKRRYPDSPWI